MSTYIALLRGINVGKAKRVPMAQLRELLTGLGYDAVETLLNSGNAVFQAKRGSELSHAKAISAAMQQHFGFEVPVIAKSAQTLGHVVAENPFVHETVDHSKLLVAFASEAQALAGLRSLESLVSPPERFAVGGSAAFLYCANGILESQVAAAMLGKAGKAVTTRNWSTTLKLHALAQGGDGR